jgi:hypothetical protein
MRSGAVALAHLVQKGELVREFRVLVRIREVAARRHIEIVQNEAVERTRLGPEAHRQMPPVRLAAELMRIDSGEGKAGEDRDPVIALDAVHGDVLVTEPAQGFQRKAVVRALRFLQAEQVGTRGGDEALDEAEAQTHRIDVPGRDGQAHGEGLEAVRDSAGRGSKEHYERPQKGCAQPRGTAGRRGCAPGGTPALGQVALGETGGLDRLTGGPT